MRAVFAIPGDKDQRTGGYLYNANVLAELNAAALTVSYLRLPDSFPVPSEPDLRQAHGLLADIPSDVPIIVDGLALGAMNPNEVASIKAPIIALVHHPLGLETGLAKDDAARLIANERAVLAHAAHVIVTSGHTAATLIADFDVSADRLTTALPGFARPAIARSPSAPPLILTVGLLTMTRPLRKRCCNSPPTSILTSASRFVVRLVKGSCKHLMPAPQSLPSRHATKAMAWFSARRCCTDCQSFRVAWARYLRQ